MVIMFTMISMMAIYDLSLIITLELSKKLTDIKVIVVDFMAIVATIVINNSMELLAIEYYSEISDVTGLVSFINIYFYFIIFRPLVTGVSDLKKLEILSEEVFNGKVLKRKNIVVSKNVQDKYTKIEEKRIREEKIRLKYYK